MKKLKIMALALLLASPIFAQTRDYLGLQKLVLKFYGYQRAGLASGSCYNQNAGFTNASHNGDNYNGNKLDGGWYDAGDYIKFGMNLSYSVYCLLKGYDVFPSGYKDTYSWSYGASDQVPDVLNEAKVATDYMMKAVIDANTIVLDVGRAEQEHAVWGVTNASGRSGSQIGLCTGGDIPATYAACLALMSTLYKKYDAAYATQCLEKAKIAFAFAKKKFDAGGDANYYSTPQLKAGAALYDYSKESGSYERQINDRMVAAGVELYRATNDGDPIYKTWAKKSISAGFNCMGYAFIGPLASFEVWRQGLGGATSLATNVGFVETKVKTSGIFANVYQNSGWGTARDVGTAAFEYALGYVTTSSEAARTTYMKRIKDHIDWLAGWASGGRSYISGFNNGPTRIHYRTTNYGAVPGGVVSGPDGDGKWSDDGTPDHSEVAIDYNAGLVGALGFLNAYNDPGTDIKVLTPFAATTKDVDFTKGSVTFSASFSGSVTWTLKIIGAFGTKTITKTGTSINEVWDGSADKNAFLSGEIVSASLQVKETIIAYDILKIGAIPITITKAKKPAAKEKDIVVDNFDDGDTVNMANGNWVKFGTGTGMRQTSISFVTDSGSKAMMVSCAVSTNDNKNNAGVKATFNKANTPCNIGMPTSVAFDLRGSAETNVRVELEQPSITDGAYFGIDVPITSVGNRYRVNIADFAQPDWKTSAKTLDLTNISGLRFTVYDSVSTVKLYIDNVAVENLSTSVRRMNSNLTFSNVKPVLSNAILTYGFPQSIKGTLDVAVYNVAGKVVMKKTFNTNACKSVALPLSNLPTGLYTVVNSVNGTVVGESMKFVHTK